MNSIAAHLIPGLKTLEGLLGSPTFTWRNSEVPCIPTTEQVGTMVIVGGFEKEVTLSLIVRRAHFITFDSTLITMDSDLYTMDSDLPTPVAGKTLVFRGVTYRIVLARSSPDDSHARLDLADFNR